MRINEITNLEEGIFKNVISKFKEPSGKVELDQATLDQAKHDSAEIERKQQKHQEKLRAGWELWNTLDSTQPSQMTNAQLRMYRTLPDYLKKQERDGWMFAKWEPIE